MQLVRPAVAAPYLVLSTDGVLVRIKVLPGSSRNALKGVLGDRLKVALQAPPVDGKANQALIDYFAELLGISRRSIQLTSGAASRQKQILISGITPEILSKLEKLGCG